MGTCPAEAGTRASCRFLLTSCPPPPHPCTSGRGLEAKEKYPFGFFSSAFRFFFFLREVIFYGGFILKEEHNPRQKKKSIYLSLPCISPAFRKLHSCLKTKEGSSRSQGRGVLFQSPLPAFLPPAASPTGALGTGSLRGRCAIFGATSQALGWLLSFRLPGRVPRPSPSPSPSPSPG